MRLKGKIVLVTGSTDGVGRVVARRPADQGARVLIHGRDRHRGQQVVDQIPFGRGSAIFLPADFSSLAEVRRLAKEVRQISNRFDVLINNAGIGSGGSTSKREISQDGYELWSLSIYERPNTRINGHVLRDIQYEIEPAGEAVASVRYPHQQFALE
jgi:NAD(P)-dependent dehydrogenase (short-subunit alcohol dehydrogenase family)